jgi:hypothetical protein
MVPTPWTGTVKSVRQEREKERQERDHLLMREINHRAKNMLSVVGAIAQQTATKSREDFRERLSARILSLSANQDLLVRNDWNGAEIEDLVPAQLAPSPISIEQRLGVLQDRRVETFGEPAVDGREKITGFDAFTLIAPEAGEAGGGAQFRSFCALPFRDGERLTILLLSHGMIAHHT